MAENKVKEAIGFMKDRLRETGLNIENIILFGSQTNREATEESDVDILVVGDVTLAEVIETLSPVQLTLNREINPTVYPVKEFRAKHAAGHHFLKSVLEGKKVFLIGDEHDLAKPAS